MVSRAVVLVVEDHALIRLCALDLVRAAGFEGIGAKSADEAIAILETRPDIRVVFTDVEMPGSMDGLKLAHYVRDRWPPIQLIVVSGRRVLDETTLPSNSRFFAKPYDDNTIIHELTTILAASPQDGSGKSQQLS